MLLIKANIQLITVLINAGDRLSMDLLLDVAFIVIINAGI